MKETPKPDADKVSGGTLPYEETPCFPDPWPEDYPRLPVVPFDPEVQTQ